MVLSCHVRGVGGGFQAFGRGEVPEGGGNPGTLTLAEDACEQLPNIFLL